MNSREPRRLLDIGEGQHLAADRVLERQQARAREVRIVGLDRALDGIERDRAVGLVVERLRLHAAEDRRAAAFPAVAVRLLADDVLVAALAMREDRAEIALGAGGHEQRRLEAEQVGDLLLQRVDARVVGEDIVAERRREHGFAHRGGWLGDRVAAKVDQAGWGRTAHSFTPGSSGASRVRAP